MAGEKKSQEQEEIVPLSRSQFDALMDRLAALEAAAKTPSGDTVNAQLAQAITDLADQAQRGPIKSLPVHKTKQRTPWNRSGAKHRIKFNCPIFLNGFRLQERMHSVEEIKLLNQIALKPGHYGPGKRMLVISKSGPEGVHEINIWLPNKTQQDRMDTKQFGMNVDPSKSGLVTILEKLLAESSDIKLAYA